MSDLPDPHDAEAFLNYFAIKRTPEELEKIYDEWAKTYDETVAKQDYHGPIQLAEIVDNLGLPKDIKILDVGCGTGIFGMLLKNKGYTNIHGVDGSSGMLEVARSRNIYKSLEERILREGTKTSHDDDSVDLVVACGSIGLSHIGADAFPEFFRILKKGSLLAWIDFDDDAFTALDKDYRKNFDKIVNGYIEAGKCKPRENVKIPKSYLEKDGVVRFLEKL